MLQAGPKRVLWPELVPPTTQARYMLRGEQSAGRFYRQHEEFVAGLKPYEREAVASGQPDALEEVLVARYRAALAMGTLPPYADEVNHEEHQALVAQMNEAVQAASAAEQKAAPPLKGQLAENRETLAHLAAALRNFVPGVNPAISAPRPPEPVRPAERGTAPHKEWAPPKKKVTVVGVALVLGALGLVALLLLSRQLG